MFTLFHTPPAHVRKRGLSLVEISIVLGIIGVVIGGIWVVYSNSQQSMVSSRIYQQVIQTTKQVRDYYAGRALPTGAIASGTFTGNMRSAGVFPEDMCPANCVSGGVTTIYNAHGGLVTASVPATSNQYELVFNRLLKRTCIQLAMQLSARSSETGLVSYRVNANGALTSFPISIADASNDCDHATEENTVTMVFKIRN